MMTVAKVSVANGFEVSITRTAHDIIRNCCSLEIHLSAMFYDNLKTHICFAHGIK